MHLIKRYANRKLYSTKESTYITLQDVSDLVVLEEEFRVIDNKTGADITLSTIQSAVAEIALPKVSLELLKALLINTNVVDEVQEAVYTNVLN